MNKFECVGESPKHPSNEVKGQHAIGDPGGLKVASLDVRPRKGSTVPFKKMVKKLEKLELASADGKETNESASLPSSSRFKLKSAGKSISPTKPNASKSSLRKTRQYSGSSIPDFLSDVACRTTSRFKQAENDTVFSQSLRQECREGTGAQARSQGQAGSLQSPGFLHVASLDQSKHPKLEPEEKEEVRNDAECKAPVALFAEFLKAMMDKDYALGKKLCQMILVFEPENPEATQFMVLIEKKLLSAGKGEEDESSDDTEDNSDSSDSRSSGNSDRSSSSEDEEVKKKKHRDCPLQPVSE